MQHHRQLANLALVGFMGTGKTSIGRLVADQLHFRFLDTDEIIQARTGLNSSVIATGGGLPTNAENLEQLKTYALVVCLWASPEKIWERVRNQSHRPLLHDPDPQKKIRDLLAVRAPFYRQADVLINTDLRAAREVAQQVALQYKLATRPPR